MTQYCCKCKKGKKIVCFSRAMLQNAKSWKICRKCTHKYYKSIGKFNSKYHGSKLRKKDKIDLPLELVVYICLQYKHMCLRYKELIRKYPRVSKLRQKQAVRCQTATGVVYHRYVTKV